MGEKRVTCQAPRCRNQILPATAARTGGICRPCEQRIAREEHAAYVQAHRREVDPFQGVTDPVEIVRLLIREPVRDELIDERPFQGDLVALMQSLTPAQIGAVTDLAATHLAEDTPRGAKKIALWLAAFTSADLTELQHVWLGHDRTDPGIIFRDAADDVARTILGSLPSERAGLHHALSALAWIGTPLVQDVFRRWRDAPPAWAHDLYAPPHSYPHVAGWELDRDDSRRTLYRAEAFALVPSGDATAAEGVGKAAGRCAWCRRRLTSLLRINTAHPALSGLPLPDVVATCSSCVFYGPLFMTTSSRGEPALHPKNVKPAHFSAVSEPEWKPKIALALGPRRGKLHAAHQSLPVTFSQLGGAPAWIQHADYPVCPDCTRTMPFVAQIAIEEVDEDMEGTFYGFWCSTCRVTATTYQTS